MHPSRRAAIEALKPGEEPAGWMWADLLAGSEIAYPWPYTVIQIDAIGTFLDKHLRHAQQRRVVGLARHYLARRKARLHLPKKPDPAAEVEALAAAIEELLKVLEEMSPEAINRLARPVLPALADQASLSIIYRAAVAFRDANPALERDYVEQELGDENDGARASSTLEPPTRRGRPPELLRRRLLTALREIFRESHPDAKSLRGYPKFERLAIAPLGLNQVDAKAMEKARTPVKQGGK